MQTTLYLIRHGHVHNPEDVFYGRLPGFRLSEEGCEQAQAAAEALKDISLDAIFCGPLHRVQQTAAYVGAHHPHLKIKRTPMINEVFTPYEGMPAQITDQLNGDIYSKAPIQFEQPMDILRRVRRFINRQRIRYPGGQVAAITHGDVVAFTIIWANRLAVTPENKSRLHMLGVSHGYPATASITSLIYESDDPEERPFINYERPY